MAVFLLSLSMLGLAKSEEAKPIKGFASWYGKREQGRRMANGHPFDRFKLTAASNMFPLGTRLFVTFTQTGRTVIVTVTDRGPFVKPRIIDLSEGAAAGIGLKPIGIGLVEIKRVDELSTTLSPLKETDLIPEGPE